MPSQYKRLMRFYDHDGNILLDAFVKYLHLPGGHYDVGKWENTPGEIEFQLNPLDDETRCKFIDQSGQVARIRYSLFDQNGNLLEGREYDGTNCQKTVMKLKNGDDNKDTTFNYSFKRSNYFWYNREPIVKPTLMPEPELRYFFSVLDDNNNPIIISTLVRPKEPPIVNPRVGDKFYYDPGKLYFKIPSMLRTKRDTLLNLPAQNYQLRLKLMDMNAKCHKEWQYDNVKIRELSNYETVNNCPYNHQYMADMEIECEYQRMRYTFYNIPEPPKPTDNPWNGLIGLATIGSIAAALWWMVT
jgi:hypothetical protein